MSTPFIRFEDGRLDGLIVSRIDFALGRRFAILLSGIFPEDSQAASLVDIAVQFINTSCTKFNVHAAVGLKVLRHSVDSQSTREMHAAGETLMAEPASRLQPSQYSIEL